MTEYETILVDTRDRVGWITLNRPEALNALNSQVKRDIVAATVGLDADPTIGAIVITGSDRAFAAGADIKEMEGVAETIASKSLPALFAAKTALDAALEITLSEGLRIERLAFAPLFDTADQEEGMAAFREKRQAEFQYR